jgi:endonuclease YncB( thermonuclease family)
MKLWPGWLVVMAAACGGAPAHSSTTTPSTGSNGANATIERVIDGDTVDATIGGHDEHVRLIGIDTPETKKPNTPIECFGPEASAYTESLLPSGTEVRIERDIEARDDYGRLLGYVYRASDGLFVNLAVVADGYARPLTIPPNVAYAADFVQAARDAEAADLGLWGGCSG